MSDLIKLLNENQGVVAVILAVVTAVIGLIWNLKKDQTTKTTKFNKQIIFQREEIYLLEETFSETKS
jgi:hypothetical protein